MRSSDVIIKNTVFNAAGRFWGILVSLSLTPYIIKHVGIERYGIWAFLGILTNYFSLLDLGMGTSFVKYVSEYHARKDYGSLNCLVSTGVVFYSAFAALVIPASFLAMDGILSAFSIPAQFYPEASFVFKLGIVLFVVSNAQSAFQSVQEGLQRMDVSNNISIGVSVPMIAGTVYFLEKGYGLAGLMMNNAIIMALTTLANIWAAYRILPELEFRPRFFNGAMFKKMFSFGFKLQFAKFANLVVFQADKLLIAYFLNVTAVGVYQLGSTVAQHMRMLPLLLVSAVLPAASGMDARNEHEKIRELYLKGSKYLILTGFPLVFFTAVSAGRIMLVWLGPGYESSALVIQFLALGYLVNLVAGVGVSVGAAIGKPEYQMGAAIISAVSNIALSAALILLFGLLGAASAETIALVLGPVYFFIKLHRQLDLPTGEIVRKIVLLPLFAASAASAAAVLSLAPILGLSGTPSGRVANLEVLLASCAVFSAAYLAIIFKSRYLDGYDFSLLKRLLSPLGGEGWLRKC